MSSNHHSAIPLKVVLSIIATGIMSFCGVIVETAMNITFPTLMEEFQVTTSTVQWLTTGYLLMVAIVVPLSATLKKRFNLKSLFLFANLSFLLGLLIDSFAPNFRILLLVRVIQGLGTGVALPLMFNIILEQVPVEKRGTMMGVGTLITAVAPAIGPTFGGIVVSSLGWRYIFVLLLPFILCSLVIGLKCIQQLHPTQCVSVDRLSIVFVVITFVGLIVGFSEFGSKVFLSLAVSGPLLIGVIGLLLFIQRSTKIEHPLIDIRVLKVGTFGGHVFAFFVLQLSTLGMSFILPNYIQLVNGSSATVAGLVILPAAILGAIMSPISGKILDSFGARKPILTGACFILLSLIIFTMNISAMKNSLILIVYILYMFGLGLLFGNIMTSGLSQLSVAQQSDGNAILNTLQQFAGATGTSIVSAIIAISQTSGRGTQAHLTAIGSRNALLILTIIMGITLFVLFKSVKGRTDVKIKNS